MGRKYSYLIETKQHKVGFKNYLEYVELDTAEEYYTFLIYDNYKRFINENLERVNLKTINYSYAEGVEIEKKKRGINKSNLQVGEEELRRLENLYTNLFFGDDSYNQEARKRFQKIIINENTYLRELQETLKLDNLFQEGSITELSEKLKNTDEQKLLLALASQQQTTSLDFIEKVKRILEKMQDDAFSDINSGKQKTIKDLAKAFDIDFKATKDKLLEAADILIATEKNKDKYHKDNWRVGIQKNIGTNQDAEYKVIRKQYAAALEEKLKDKVKYEDFMQFILAASISFATKVGLVTYLQGVIAENSALLTSFYIQEALANGTDKLLDDAVYSKIEEKFKEDYIKDKDDTSKMLKGSTRIKTTVQDGNIAKYEAEVLTDHVSKVDLAISYKFEDGKEIPMNFSIKNYSSLENIHLVSGTRLDDVVNSFKYKKQAQFHLLNVLASRENNSPTFSARNSLDDPEVKNTIKLLNSYFYIVALMGYFSGKNNADFLFLINNKQVKIIPTSVILNEILNDVQIGKDKRYSMRSNLEEQFGIIANAGSFQGDVDHMRVIRGQFPNGKDGDNAYKEAIAQRNQDIRNRVFNVYKAFNNSRISVTMDISRDIFNSVGGLT